MKTDEHLFCNLEDYLSQRVRPRFHKDGAINAFDFFSIVVWKANRAKSHTAKRLLKISKQKNLNRICKNITKALWNARHNKERMRVLISDWRFKLPMASAILTILYPDKFTIFDIRAEEQVRDRSNLGAKTEFEAIWRGYLNFVELVKKTGRGKTLREKDRYLFGKSRLQDLKRDIKANFKKGKKPFA
jgi:hypothetical protein